MASCPSRQRVRHAAFLASGTLGILLYLPLLRSAWVDPQATAASQSLLTWAGWTLCRAVTLGYAAFVLQDLATGLVVGSYLVGRLCMAALILRSRVAVAANRIQPLTRSNPCRV